MSSITDVWGYFEFNPDFYLENIDLINKYMYNAIESEHGFFEFLKKSY